MEGSPTARALRTLELLQRAPGITADGLAMRLDVTPRAARRYVAMLRDADIPVHSTRGRYGGYRLGGGVRQPPVMLSTAEALGLVMAVLDGGHSADDEDDVVGAAIGKLLRSMPSGVAGPAGVVRTHAERVRDRGVVHPSIETTTSLVDAVAERMRVRIGYRSSAGATWHEDVDPWAVVVRERRWYLLCHSHRVDAVRTYRVDRVVTVERLDVGFEPPADLDAPAELETRLGSDREFRTRVVIDAPIDQVVPWWSPVLGTLTPDGDERCVLEGTTSNPRMIAGEWLSSLPFDCTVEGGDELRAAVREVADRLRASIA